MPSVVDVGTSPTYPLARSCKVVHISASIFLTLDGVMEEPHVWHPPYASQESLALLDEQMANATAMLLGRRTYEEFASYWPHQTNDVPLAEATNAIRKYVISRMLSKPVWDNTTVLTKGMVAAVRTLAGRESSVIVPGSAQLVHGLLRAGLLSELRIMLDPLVVGRGHRLFPEGSALTELQLIDSRRLPRGVTYLVYRPVEGTDRS
nr:dihydrofolate reductase family protein [Nonomuraea polychroma]